MTARRHVWRIAHFAAALCLGALPLAAAAQTAAVEAPLAARSLLIDGAAAGERLVVVGERGHVLLSDDRGETWRQARVPVQALLTAVHMHDTRTGWAVGHDAVVIGTSDGGESWRLLHREPDLRAPLLDVWFRGAEAGFAVGAFGLFLATTDGGESWTCRNGCLDGGTADGEPPLLAGGNGFEDGGGDDFHLNAIASAGPRRLFLAGEAGALYRSDDGGETWRGLDSPYGGSWFGALALDPETLLVAGLRGHLFRSADGGESWDRIDSGTSAALTAVVRAGGGRIAVTGLSGTLLFSSDGGRSVSARPLATRRGVSTALMADDGRLLLAGEFGVAPLDGME